MTAVVDEYDIVQKYLNTKTVAQQLNTAVNELCAVRPDDPWAFLANKLRYLAAPVAVDRLQARQVLDPKGGPAVEVDVFVTGTDEVFHRERLSCGAEIHGDPQEATSKVIEGITTLSSSVRGLNPRDVKATDDALAKVAGVDPIAIGLVSQALAVCGAVQARQEPYELLASCLAGHTNQPYTLPVPVVSVLSCGRASGGKLNLAEFCVFPRSTASLSKGLMQCVSIYHQIGQQLAPKAGGPARSTEGGVWVNAADTADQALGIVEDAVKACGLSSKDVGIMVDCRAQDFYDKEKKAYELGSGKERWLDSSKTVAYYSKIASDHPTVLGFINPLAAEDQEGYTKLTSALAPKLCIAEEVRSSPDFLTQGITNKLFNSIMVKCASSDTVSARVSTVSAITASKLPFVLAATPVRTIDSFTADLSVAIGAHVLMLGAPIGERVELVNRLLQIEERLEKVNKLERRQKELVPQEEIDAKANEDQEDDDEKEKEKEKEGKKEKAAGSAAKKKGDEKKESKDQRSKSPEKGRATPTSDKKLDKGASHAKAAAAETKKA